MNAYDYDPKQELKYEIINGKAVYMSLLAQPNHAVTVGNIATDISYYLKNKKCKLYHENNYLRLDKIEKIKDTDIAGFDKNKDRFIPDIMVVCDKSADTEMGVTGAPELIVEVASPRTENYDRSVKKDVYEAIGVKEYWIVRPKDKAIEIYLLQKEKYILKDIHFKYSESDLEAFETEREDGISDIKIITEFSPYCFPDLTIKIDDVFAKFIE